MSTKRPNGAAIFVALLAVQTAISTAFFSGGRSLGEQQTLSMRSNYALRSKIEKYSRERRAYLAKHGRRR